MSESLFMVLAIVIMLVATIAYIRRTRYRSRWLRAYVHNNVWSDSSIRLSRVIFKHYMLWIVLPVVLVAVGVHVTLGSYGLLLGMVWLGVVEVFWKIIKRVCPELTRDRT